MNTNDYLTCKRWEKQDYKTQYRWFRPQTHMYLYSTCTRANTWTMEQISVRNKHTRGEHIHMLTEY